VLLANSALEPTTVRCRVGEIVAPVVAHSSQLSARVDGSFWVEF
jgi:hypothetical protein